MRVPGRMSSSFGLSFMLIEGSRNIVTTLAFEKSYSKISPLTIVAFALTPASLALN
jgi:hypothetical protein